MTELYQFEVKDGVVRHPGENGEPCFGRVFRLAYPFGWQHFYCQEKCCDHRGVKDPETGEDAGRVHVDCVTDFTYTRFYYCIDCGKVGTMPKVPS